MFKRFFGSGPDKGGDDRGEEKGSDFVIEDEEEEDKYQPNSAFMENLRLNMSKMIAYAQSADVVRVSLCLTLCASLSHTHTHTHTNLLIHYLTTLYSPHRSYREKSRRCWPMKQSVQTDRHRS